MPKFRSDNEFSITVFYLGGARVVLEPGAVHETDDPRLIAAFADSTGVTEVKAEQAEEKPKAEAKVEEQPKAASISREEQPAPSAPRKNEPERTRPSRRSS